MSGEPEGASAGEIAACARQVARELGMVLEAGMAAGQAPAAMGTQTLATLAAAIDHTILRPEATGSDIARLCAEAREYGFATVCVNGVWVADAARRLEGSGVGVSAVVGFPLGAMHREAKQYETRKAIDDGATEIDMVMHVGAVKGGDWGGVGRDIEAVASACRAARVHCKVILENALLTGREKVTACLLSVQAGADFVKTSTGFGPGGATAADVALMRVVVGPGVGVKAAGGIRDLDAMLSMLAAGANRIGASAGARILGEARARGFSPA